MLSRFIIDNRNVKDLKAETWCKMRPKRHLKVKIALNVGLSDFSLLEY